MSAYVTGWPPQLHGLLVSVFAWTPPASSLNGLPYTFGSWSDQYWCRLRVVAAKVTDRSPGVSRNSMPWPAAALEDPDGEGVAEGDPDARPPAPPVVTVTQPLAGKSRAAVRTTATRRPACVVRRSLLAREGRSLHGMAVHLVS